MPSGVKRDDLSRLALLWWAGVNLRVTLLAVPPLIPLIHEDLDLDAVSVGALNALPVLLLAVAAVSGSLLIARIGARRALIAGLIIVGAASALRGLGRSTEVLFGMTFIMGVGVAMMQPAMPAVARAWCPASVGFATATYANGLVVGEILSASLTIPLILPLVGGSWPWAFVVWSVPAALTAIAIMALAPDPAAGRRIASRGWPDWRSGRTWRAGLILGGGASLYFTTNAFIPDLLHARGEAGLVGAALTSLNAGQVPASILMTLFPTWLMTRRGPLVAVAFTGAAALVGLLATSGAWTVAWAGLAGFSAAFTLIWTLALPAMIAAPEEVPRLSAAIFTIGYLCAFVSPLLGGAAWELSGVPGAGLLPAGCALVVLVLSVAGLALPRAGSGRIEAEPPARGRFP